MRRVAISILLASTVLAACGSGDDDRGAGGSAGAIEVVAAFYPLAFAAERVGGELVEVTNITPPGVEAHDLELTPDQVDAIEDADVVLYVGGGFQPAIEKVADRVDTALDPFAGAHAIPGEDDGHGHEADPHFWLNVDEYAHAVERVGDAISAALPEGDRAEARENTQALLAELAALDGEFDAGLATCARRAFVTSHAAFGHLAEQYDLEQLSVSGLSPESEPDPARLDELADEIRDRGITTVFYEELVSPEVAEALAREAGATAAVLSPLEGLTEEQAASGEDYLSVMRDNLSALRKALECS